MSTSDSTADRRLLRLAQQGSEAAWEAIYDRFLPLVWRYVYARVGGDLHAAEDVLSEVFLAALDGLNKLDAETGSPYPWLIGVARHKLADHWRRLRRGTGDRRQIAPELADPSTAGSPQTPLEVAERKDRVARAMARLGDEHRLVLEWKYLDELSAKEIALRMQRTERAVESLLYRAREAFRAAYPETKSRRPIG